MAHPGFERRVNPNAVENYLDLGYLPSEQSIFGRTQKLKPGHFLTFDLDKFNYLSTQYWSVESHYSVPRSALDYPTAKAKLHELVRSACKYRTDCRRATRSLPEWWI